MNDISKVKKKQLNVNTAEGRRMLPELQNNSPSVIRNDCLVCRWHYKRQWNKMAPASENAHCQYGRLENQTFFFMWRGLFVYRREPTGATFKQKQKWSLGPQASIQENKPKTEWRESDCSDRTNGFGGGTKEEGLNSHGRWVSILERRRFGTMWLASTLTRRREKKNLLRPQRCWLSMRF